MGDDVNDIRHLVGGLTAKQIEALNSLETDPNIDKACGGLAFRYRQDKDDIKQELALKVLKQGAKFDEVKSPGAWFTTAIKNDGKNKHRHRKIEKRFQDRCTSESVQYKMNDGKTVIQRPVVLNPEEIQLEREKELEQGALWEERRSQLTDRILNVVNSFPPEKAAIALRVWADGERPEDISQEVKKSVKTIYRITREVQLAIIAGIGTEDITEDPKVAAAFRRLIAKSLRDAVK